MRSRRKEKESQIIRRSLNLNLYIYICTYVTFAYCFSFYNQNITQHDDFLESTVSTCSLVVTTVTVDEAALAFTGGGLLSRGSAFLPRSTTPLAEAVI